MANQQIGIKQLNLTYSLSGVEVLPIVKADNLTYSTRVKDLFYPGAITTAAIADGSVTTAKLAAESITAAKLSYGAPTWTSSRTVVNSYLHLTANNGITPYVPPGFASPTPSVGIELGQGATRDHYTYIDFHAAGTGGLYSSGDAHTRIARGGGLNGSFALFNSGFGDFVIRQQQAAPIKFFIDNDQTSMIIRPSGNVGIGTDHPTNKLSIVGNMNTTGTITTSVLSADKIFFKTISGPNGTADILYHDSVSHFRRDVTHWGNHHLHGHGFYNGNLTVSGNLYSDSMLFQTVTAGKIRATTDVMAPKVTITGTPTANTDATTKAYVDTAVSQNLTQGTAKAFVSFNTNGTIRKAFNVSSVVKSSSPAGTYTITFTNPMPDTNFVTMVSNCTIGASGVDPRSGGLASAPTLTNKVIIRYLDHVGVAVDPIIGSVVIY